MLYLNWIIEYYSSKGAKFIITRNEDFIILEKELAIKDKLIEVLREALNEPRYCEDHVIFRKCSKKDLMCGDCLVKEFY